MLTPGDTRHGAYGSDIGYNPNNSTYIVYVPVHSKIYAFYSTDPAGPYSGPVDMNIDGYDPCFFCDDDGNCYLVTNKGDLLLLERNGLYVKCRITNIKQKEGWFEGAQLYKHGGYYYCLYSGGGTRPHQHSSIETMRAKSLAGPWEMDPNNPQLYADDTSGAKFQGPAHGSLVQGPDDKWYVTFHAHELSHYTLGRQMCMARIEWTEDGWWRPTGGPVPPSKAVVTGLKESRLTLADSDDFNDTQLGNQWFFLTCSREGECFSLCDRPGYLRVYTRGRDLSSSESLCSVVQQRVKAKKFEISTKLHFEALNNYEAAGLTLYHNPDMNLWLCSTVRDGAKIIEVGKTVRGKVERMFVTPNRAGETVYLKIEVDGAERATFYYSSNGSGWAKVGGSIYFGDSWHDLRAGVGGSPDLGWVGVKKENVWTAATMGLFAVSGDTNVQTHADFDWFKVQEAD